MPQERGDARKMERELKIKFEWREADKNLEKEERNKPVDFTSAPIDALLQMETRSWRSGDVSAQNQVNTVGRLRIRIARRMAAPDVRLGRAAGLVGGVQVGVGLPRTRGRAAAGVVRLVAGR